MSGGSYDYAYRQVEEMAASLRANGHCSAAAPALRELFREHLWDVAKAMRAIEWNDSCDGDGGEVALITKCLSGRLAEGSVDRVLEHAEKALVGIQGLRAALGKESP